MAGRNSGAAAIDGAAITLSGLCLVHCLALPLVSASLPIAGIWADAEWLHKAFVVAALPFSALALRARPVNWAVIGLIVLGLVLLVLGAFVEPLHDYEVQLTVIGAVALSTGHALRWIRGYGSGH
ncbi:MAG: MerC domain-containing protein [Pseudomonadota bacterium]